MTDQEYFRNIASHALAGFQLIEVGLKDYIADYHDKVRASLPSNMTYKYGARDVEDAPLGKLITLFERTNSNEVLALLSHNYLSPQSSLHVIKIFRRRFVFNQRNQITFSE